MLTAEDRRVLEYLRRHGCAPVGEVARACLSGAPPEWLGRVVAHLDWMATSRSTPGRPAPRPPCRSPSRG
jgi:hypothetical protein